MFMLKSILGKMWGDPSNPELVQLAAGQLYLVRPNSVKSSRECIFKDAVATIRRTSMPHQFQLVITRAYEESEAQLLDEDAETEDEKLFLIDPSLEFRSSEFEGEPSFAWRDLDSLDEDSSYSPTHDGGSPPEIEDELFEFVADSKQVNSDTMCAFEVTMLQCMFERRYQASHEIATEAQLEAFKFKPSNPSKSLSQSRTPDGSTTDLASTLQSLSVSDSAALSSSFSPATPVKSKLSLVNSAFQTPAKPGLPEIVEPDQQLPVLHSQEGELYLFDIEVGHFVLQGEVTAQVIETGAFSYSLACKMGGDYIVGQPMDSEMNPRWSKEALAFMWNFVAEDNQTQVTWSFRFNDLDAYIAFNEIFNRCVWEAANRVSWAKAEDQEYVKSLYEDVEMKDIPEEEEEEPLSDDDSSQDISDIESATFGASEDEDSDDDDTSGAPVRTKQSANKAKNKQLAVGYKHDRSYVSRGDMIGVFKHTEDGQVKHSATINKLKLGGKFLNPVKMMLHQQDTSMIIQDAANPFSLFKVDMEVGKVVDEWKVSDSVGIKNILPDSKYAQMTDQQTLVGHSHNSLFRIDPRLAGKKMVQEELKTYAASSKMDFSAAATTESGNIALASNKGDIKLYDNAIGKNAKTALPAIGDPILGMDVTADGRYIIATCKTYLLLIDTLIGSGKYTGSTGFERSFPKEAKPTPVRLDLKLEHVAYMGGKVSFTPAKFDTGTEGEKTIVTSSGPFVIIWNFKKVKKGRKDDYQLKRYDQEVVADSFRHGADKNIVVALPENVFMVNKKQLSKPTRESLSTPTKLLRSRSDIVDSPY